VPGQKLEYDPRTSEEVFAKRKLALSDFIDVGGRRVSTSKIIMKLGPLLTEERIAKLHSVVGRRSFQFVSVLENIFDRGNVSAVMRSADAFGFARMHLVDAPGAKFKAANRVSKGAEKWLDVHMHSSAANAVGALKKDGFQVFATDLATDRVIDDLDFSKPLAVVLGNEKDGCSKEMLAAVDGTFRIPMYGFSQSFNISVAAALIYYHARLKIVGGLEAGSPVFDQVLANYYLRCFDNPEMYFG
jgi:tRNA (guanosine-2'-O-)-methyltransferase